MLNDKVMIDFKKIWKDKTFLSVTGVALAAVVLGYVMAKNISWGWLLAECLGAGAGIAIRNIVMKRKDKVGESE